MTIVYFVRHAESRYDASDDFVRPLTESGMANRECVTRFLWGRGIDAVFSSPYKRALDTVSDFAQKSGLQAASTVPGIVTVNDFRERKVGHKPVADFFEYAKRQWADFSYKLDGGESLGEVQRRNIAALERILDENRDKNIVIGTHGTALSTVIRHYNALFGYEDFLGIIDVMPWIVRLSFDGLNCFSLVSMAGAGRDGIFTSMVFDKDEYRRNGSYKVSTHQIGELKSYKYVVIFARYKGKWLYSRHKERDTFETAGGHIEPGEAPIAAARRELYEETGATKFDIKPVFDYAVRYPTEFSFGQVFYAEIAAAGALPESEMAEIVLFEGIPEKMTYPHILPVLFDKLLNGMGQDL